MEGEAVQVIECSTDLTPVLEALETVNFNLQQLQANTDYIFLSLWLLAGVVVGCCIGYLFHDLWRV